VDALVDPVLDHLPESAAHQVGQVLAVDRMGFVLGCWNLLHAVRRTRLGEDGHPPHAALSILFSHKDVVMIGPTLTTSGSKVNLAHGLVHRKGKHASVIRVRKPWGTLLRDSTQRSTRRLHGAPEFGQFPANDVAPVHDAFAKEESREPASFLERATRGRRFPFPG
jgi:hypothetical protein